MGFFYIIDNEGRYLGNINGDKVLFHRANSSTFQHRQTRDMIEKLKERAESLGASNLQIMEAKDMDEAKAYMIATYCNGNASSLGPKRGRPVGSGKGNASNCVHRKQKKIEFTFVEPDEEEEEYISQPESDGNDAVERSEEEKKYLKAINDPDVKAMFEKCNVNKKCMLCRRLCKQPSTSVIYQCPQYQYDEYRDMD